jgi:hypothetical protein
MLKQKQRLPTGIFNLIGKLYDGLPCIGMKYDLLPF